MGDMSTTEFDPNATLSHGGSVPPDVPNELNGRYESLLNEKRLNWTTHYQLQRLLGSGGQGVVYLSERRGADQFTLPVALKIFSPARYKDAFAYDAAMTRMARTSAKIAQIQHDHLLNVHNFVDRNRIRMLVMEWIDGYDLAQLLAPETLDRIYHRASKKRWEYLNRVIVTAGPVQPRLKPGMAVAIVRDCLGALAALHREGLAHGDIKPSNIMLKSTGTAKIVDIGAAFELAAPPEQRMVTPTYAPPEVLEGNDYTQRSDLASLGYVLIELLAGQPPFGGLKTYRELLEAKRSLPRRLPSFMPPEVSCNNLLMNFCSRLIATDPLQRFPSAEAADMQKDGAAGFLRQLVKGDLASEYDNELRIWVEELKEMEQE
jgi:eukaryotic-like serine/threonine-protein kinase